MIDDYMKGFRDGKNAAFGWHSVEKDGPPKESGTYLVTTARKAVILTHFYAEVGHFSSTSAVITHWAPKPAPAED